MPIVFILLGAFLGAAVHEGSGFLLGAVVGWLFMRSLRQQREIEALRQQLDAAAPREAGVAPRLAAGAADAASAVDTMAPGARDEARSGFAPENVAEAMPEAPPAASPLIVSEAGPATGAGSEAPSAPDVVRASATAPAQGDELAPHAATASAPPAWVASARDWLFGGNTIVKAGVGILFIGLAFLAKYASEHVSLPVELRLAAIATVAVVLLVLGWRLRLRRAGFAQVLQGGAIAVLYLTLFAAFRFYGLIGGGAAFALMALVAAFAAALAVLQDARSLAVVGALGGFATPLLLSSGGGSHVALFSYDLVLCLGIAAVAWYRTWRELNLIGFFFSFGIGTAWGLMDYRSAYYVSAQGFLVAFFLVFMAILLLPARRVPRDAETRAMPHEADTRAAPHEADTRAARRESDNRAARRGERWVNGTLLFGLPTVAFGLQYGLVKDMANGPALSALAAAGFYIVLARWLRARPHLALAFEGCLAVGTVFVTLVIPFALDVRAVSGAWALEGAGLVWLGWRQQRRLARAFGDALLVIAGFALLHAVDRHPLPTSWVNATLLSGAMLVAGALIAAFVTQRHAPRPADGEGEGATVGERVAEPLFIAWALLAAVALIVLHLDALVDPLLRLSGGIAAFSGLAALFTLLARRLAWRGVAAPVLGLAPLLWLASAMSADFQPQPFVQGGWWAWPIALAAHLLALRVAAPFWPALGAQLAHAIGALVLGMVGASAGRGLLLDAGDAGSAWPWLGWLAVPALMLLALPQPVLAARWPLRERPLAYQRDAAAVISAALVGWTLLANAFSPGVALPLPYLPLVNPLDLGVALALFAVWRFARLEPGRSLLAPRPPLLPVVLGTAVFVWLNAMLVRGFHHLGGVPFELDAWSHSLAVQTGLTLLWTATAMALMWFSARRGMRVPWMVGAALLAVVVLKLLLVDLSGSGTVTRIVSFIGAGVLMLVIGYVAPLPARTGGAAAESNDA